MGGMTNQVTHKSLGQNAKSSNLRVDGLTWPEASALVQNLSPSTYEWKDEPSYSRVSWSKFKSFCLRVEGRTKSLTSALVKIYDFLPSGGMTNQATTSDLVQNLSPSTYEWNDKSSHQRVPWSMFKVLLPTSERTKQVSNNCLGTKFKSFYLRVEGRTKSLTSDSVENLVLLLTGGRTNQVNHDCLGQNLSPYTYR